MSSTANYFKSDVIETSTLLKSFKLFKSFKSFKLFKSSIPSSIRVLSINSYYYLTNDVTINDTLKRVKTPAQIGVGVVNYNVNLQSINTHFPIVLRQSNTIMIPTKVKTLLERYLPKPLLDKIHGGDSTIANREIAVELCLLFLSQLASTYRNIENGKSPDGWKSLRAEYLRQLLRIDAQTYQHVIDALLYKYNEGAIIERGEYCEKRYSTKFRLGEAYRGKGFKSYQLLTGVVQTLSKRSCDRKINAAKENVICSNLIEFYKVVQLPTIKEVEDEGKMLIASNYTNKKGKRLISLNKKAKSDYEHLEQLSFVEDAIKIYKFLTENGLLIPEVGSDPSGGRVVDSFTLMPSWIRKLVKVNGQPMVECDYSCLHPNVAMSLYGGTAKNLTHDLVSAESGIDKSKVKVEHLSFFNKNKWSMQGSEIYDYYQNSQPIMMDNIISEKQLSEHKHKVTSRTLFKKEVEIMTTVIERLNDKGIYVGYAYDALFCCPDHSFLVKSVMDEVIVELGVYTTAKIG
jgi:hypothetical protein